MVKNDIYEELYKEEFEIVYLFLKQGLKNDLDEDIKVVSATLDTLYTYEGLDLIGRGEIIQTKISANIGATEVVLQELLEMKEKQKV